MFSQQIIDWYKLHKRDLPWRNSTDPYKIWLSEIMLQQTRVDQGLGYYLKFIDHYSTVHDLAGATEQQVLNDWQGLGYYSRARNLHATAKHISEQLNGVFPSTYNELLKLKGVGPYTAAAIASFAFNEPKALVDGNVYRVLARYFNIALPIDSTQGKKEFQELADSLIDSKNPATYNQAIMEFGALQCVPANPDCENCVLRDNCQAYSNKTVASRPVKEKKTKVRTRYFYYFIAQEGEFICLKTRTESDIWQHLFEFPLVEKDNQLSDSELIHYCKQQFQQTPVLISPEQKHLLSHQRIMARFIHLSKIPQEWQSLKIKMDAIENHPLPRLIERYYLKIIERKQLIFFEMD
ncbi:MAG: A/G-specific adenine glycosylase [Crocinitomicaceae bacterium]|nr:A/G-specific adenine glycosylase [Crocinitomicaceae bacterium]